MNKELLREFAYDLLDLLEENERLQEENKELKKYKKAKNKRRRRLSANATRHLNQRFNDVGRKEIKVIRR